MIGVFGGTFDPIHIGHLRSAVEVADRLDVRVHMIPAGDPPHRAPPHATAEQRLAMLKLALAGQQQLLADDREIRRRGRSFMVDTLTDLRQQTGQSLALVLGHDAFAGLPGWHQWRRLFDLAHIVVLERAGENRLLPGELLREVAERQVAGSDKLMGASCGLVYYCELAQLEVSATAIRRLLMAGRSARFLTPQKVLDYIERTGLYR